MHYDQKHSVGQRCCWLRSLKRGALISFEMIRATEPLSIRSLNCLGFDDGAFERNSKKARADFRMFLNHGHTSVADCRRVRPVRAAKADGVLPKSAVSESAQYVSE